MPLDENNIPIVILDWDYDTFSVEGNDIFHLYDDEILKNKPEHVYIEGWPSPGWYLKRTLAKRVADSYSCYLLIQS